MRNCYYHIIDREGNIVLSTEHLLSQIGKAGLCHIEDDNAPSIYNVNNHQETPLPTQIADKQVIYRVNWKYTIEDTIVGHLIEKVNSSRQRNLICQYDTPEGMRGIASIVLDKEFRPLFDPLPLNIHPYKGERTLAENYNKRLFILDRRGQIIHEFSNEWRLKHRYDGADNLAELILYKRYEENRSPLPLYHYDIQTNSYRGPYQTIEELREGLRAVTDMDSRTYFVDDKWNVVFTCDHLRKKEPFYLLSDCYNGHIAYFSVLKAGLLDKQGKVVMKPTYSALEPIGDSLWWYKKKGYYGIMHESGKIITAPQFMISYFKYFSYGLVGVRNKKNKGGYIDHEGNWVIPPTFDACYDFIHPQYTIARTFE